MNTKADITIISAPEWANLKCPLCGECVELKFDDLVELLDGDFSGKWKGKNITCPHCKQKIEIDNVNWH